MPLVGRELKGWVICFFEHPAVLHTVPELDHFGPRTDVQYCGPCILPGRGNRLDWPQAKGRRVRILSYFRLSQLPRAQILFEILGGLPVDVIAVIPDAPQDWSCRFPNVMVTADFLDWPHMVQGTDWVLVSGSGSMVSALCQGKPAVVVPALMEQALAGLAAQRLGGAYVLNLSQEVDLLRFKVNQLFENGDRCASAARMLAQRYQHLDLAYAVNMQWTALHATMEARAQ